MQILKVEKYYYDYSIFKTHLLSSLSSVFKEGESFFMKSLTIYLKDFPEYRERIIDFCKEERMHTEWHTTMNKLLDEEHGNTAIQDLEKRTGQILSLINFLPKQYKLLITECLEHITYCLCKTALEKNTFSTLKGDSKQVFTQHCIEETGLSHSTIAGDINRRLGNQNKYIRKIVMYTVFSVLCLIMANYINYLYTINNDFCSGDFITSIHHLTDESSWLKIAIKDVFQTWK